MWLAALRREDRRDDLTDEIVTHALWLVAADRGSDTLALREYAQRRDRLIARDGERQGDDGALAALLPTSNQILAHCDLKWRTH